LLPEWPEYWEILRNAGAIWDYSLAGAEYLSAKGLEQVHHLPPGFHRGMEAFRPRPDPDIDVLFFGSPHPRRQRVLDMLKAQGLNVLVLHDAFGERRNRYIARAKIVLNVHAWHGPTPLETVRLSFLLTNRVFVISEQAEDNPYEGGVVYAPYAALVDACLDYLRRAAAERERIAANGYLAVRKLDMIDMMRTTLDNTGPELLAGLVAKTGCTAESYYAQPRDDVLGFVPADATRTLDIGCAAGLVGANIKARQPCHVTGIEIVADAAAQAATRLDLAICGDAFDVLPVLADGGYDCVLLLDVIEHVADSPGLLRLAARKLTQDGTLLLCVPNVAHWSVVQGLLEGRWEYADQGILDRTHLRFFTLDSLRQMLDEVGLRIVDCRSTQLVGATPPPAIVEAYRQNAGPGRSSDADMQSFQFLLTCRKI
jgi:2-polyprenyl-3-methyl-5-hydroxy-6-metoxy-1,4-benzoquinol methylase